MPFVQREEGRIVGVYANRQPGYAEEELSPNSAEMLALSDNEWRAGVWLDFRTRREVYLDRLSGMAMFDDAGDGVVKAACKKFRQRLLDLTADPSVSPAATPTKDALEQAIFVLYLTAKAEAVTAAPAAKVAFDRISK